MQRTSRHGGSTRLTGPRAAALVAVALSIALCGALLGPSLAAAEVAPTTPSTPKPVNTEAPKLSGAATVGQALTCSQGAWANNPNAYSYVWLRDGSPIAGQTGGTYVVQAADQGHSISCQVTASNGGGDYTIVGLPSGSYKVGFYTGSESGNYLEQFFNGKSHSAEATPVAVTAPNTTAAVNAELHAGGQIAGRVTAAATSAPLANVLVCAEEASEKFESGGCTSTSANGEYTIAGLASGSYRVEFDALFSEVAYIAQFYNGKSSLAEAEPVSVTAGATTSGIDAALRAANQGGQISGT